MRKSANPKRRNKRWPGLQQDARALGVSYGHLRLCLFGERKSKSLLARYRVLKAKENVHT